MNLANLPLADRMDMAADLEACRLIHYRKEKGKAWREWVLVELGKLNHPDRVRHFLNSRIKEYG